MKEKLAKQLKYWFMVMELIKTRFGKFGNIADPSSRCVLQPGLGGTPNE